MWKKGGKDMNGTINDDTLLDQQIISRLSSRYSKLQSIRAWQKRDKRRKRMVIGTYSMGIAAMFITVFFVMKPHIFSPSGSIDDVVPQINLQQESFSVEPMMKEPNVQIDSLQKDSILIDE